MTAATTVAAVSFDLRSFYVNWPLSLFEQDTHFYDIKKRFQLSCFVKYILSTWEWSTVVSECKVVVIKTHLGVNILY